MIINATGTSLPESSLKMTMEFRHAARILSRAQVLCVKSRHSSDRYRWIKLTYQLVQNAKIKSSPLLFLWQILVLNASPPPCWIKFAGIYRPFLQLASYWARAFLWCHRKLLKSLLFILNISETCVTSSSRKRPESSADKVFGLCVARTLNVSQFAPAAWNLLNHFWRADAKVCLGHNSNESG